MAMRVQTLADRVDRHSTEPDEPDTRQRRINAALAPPQRIQRRIIGMSPGIDDEAMITKNLDGGRDLLARGCAGGNHSLRDLCKGEASIEKLGEVMEQHACERQLIDIGDDMDRLWRSANGAAMRGEDRQRIQRQGRRLRAGTVQLRLARSIGLEGGEVAFIWCEEKGARPSGTMCNRSFSWFGAPTHESTASWP